jgi:hypothetical protein
MTAPAQMTTPALVAEYHELRGTYGEVPAETEEEREANRARLHDLYLELRARNSLPRVLSKGPGFGSDKRRRRRPGGSFGFS